MVRVPASNYPLLLGLDQVERALDKVSRSASDGYPPYNVERITVVGDGLELLRVTLAVAGFSRSEIEVTQEDSQLVISGRRQEEKARDYIHRGIAARPFQRGFILAEGMEVLGAKLASGLLTIDIARPQPERGVKRITITARD
jgi:HSP20 family molecular chaperone IbpA